MSSPPDPNDGTTQWLQEHLKQIEAKIRKRADAMADSEKRPVESRDIASAAMLYAPGLLYPDKKTELDIPFSEERHYQSQV